MPIERMLGYAIKLGQPAFCIAPERFNTVDMPFTIRKFILTMIDSKMLIKVNINQAVITAPAIRMNEGGGRYMPPNNNALQRDFRAVCTIFV